MINFLVQAQARCLVPLLVCLLFSACASITPQQRQQALELNAPANWHIIGKASLVSSQGAQNFNYSWHNRHNYERLDLFAASSNTRIFTYERDKQGSELNIPARELTVFNSDPEATLRQHLGINIPVKQLRYWLTGLPAPQERISALSFNEFARLSRLRQSGWDLQYSSYYPQRDNSLPKLIKLSNGNFSIKIFILRWELPNEWVALGSAPSFRLQGL